MTRSDVGVGGQSGDAPLIPVAQREQVCNSCGQVNNDACRGVVHTINRYRRDDENERRFQQASRELDAEGW